MNGKRISKILKRRSKKIGLPAGALVSANDHPEAINIMLIDYDVKNFSLKENASIKDCLISLDIPTVTWINICGIDDMHTIELLGRHFGLHPLLLEDIMTAGQRSKLDNYRDTLYIVVKMLSYNQER